MTKEATKKATKEVEIKTVNNYSDHVQKGTTGGHIWPRKYFTR